MRELIDRLEVVDDSAASALRVIDHFDRLVEARAAPAAVIRAAAAMAGCPAGFRDGTKGLTRRFAADGRALGEADHPWPKVSVAGRPGSSVWLEQVTTGPLDLLILERCVRALQSLTGGAAESTPTNVRVACDPDASPVDRSAAVASLGLSGPVTVVASAPGVVLSSRSTQVGEHVLTLFAGSPTLTIDVRAASARADDPADLPQAAERAVIAFGVTDRVGGPGASMVTYAELGALASVAERFTPEQALAVPDVRRLEELRHDHLWLVDTLQAVLDQQSLRKAALVLSVHHSTLQERLGWMATNLGYAVTHPGGRQRAAVAVLLWRVARAV